MHRTFFLMLTLAAMASPQNLTEPKHLSTASAPQPNATITDVERVKIREMERDYWQSQAQFCAAKNAVDVLQREIQSLYTKMQATCKATEQFDHEHLLCVEKQSAEHSVQSTAGDHR